MCRWTLIGAIVLCVALPRELDAQGLTGDLTGTVADEQGAVVSGALVELASPSLIGGSQRQITNDRGQFRFPVLPPGLYSLDVSRSGFTSIRQAAIEVGAGARVERGVRLAVAGVAESVVVEARGSRFDPGGAGVGTRFTLNDLRAIPSRRISMFDSLRSAPFVHVPTSARSRRCRRSNGTNENLFLVNGNSTTCPCGVARSEPGIDFIQEIQIQSIGASAEYGNAQGAVINVITRQGSDRFLFDMASYWQPAGLTSQPVRLSFGSDRTSGYERTKYQDASSSLGGPIVRSRLWFFSGYQHIRDYDSQPGADPALPRAYQEDKGTLSLTWRFGRTWRLEQSVQYQSWANPELPTSTKPFATTQRRHASVPAITFGHLTHVVSDRTLWEARVGWFLHDRVDDQLGDRWTPSQGGHDRLGQRGPPSLATG